MKIDENKGINIWLDHDLSRKFVHWNQREQDEKRTWRKSKYVQSLSQVRENSEGRATAATRTSDCHGRRSNSRTGQMRPRQLLDAERVVGTDWTIAWRTL